MKKVYAILSTIMVLVVLSSCGGQRTFQTNPPVGGFAEYLIIEIPDFKTSVSSIPPDATWRIPNEIAERLEREKIFIGVSRSPVSIRERVLVMEGNIVNVEPKEWYEQAIRTVRVTAHVRFVDKAENRVIAEATFEGVSKAGALSGGVPFAYYRLVDEIVEYIKHNYTLRPRY
ncbi:MAG: hypothetical protein KatS3mg078_2387 [Deltaproteobacteria bacterium]|jgi:hypothetical protein|nr:MAG: hypothetical protein KatS3mg078_2387 [Deltaproteobacteria bacterium]